MSWIDKIAFNLNIRNEEPNKALAQELAKEESIEGIKEIAEYLNDKNKSVASDCLAVLYHIGYEKPALIQDYIDDFLKLLESKNNRMVWGSMIAISTIAPLKPTHIYKHIDLLLETIKKGSVITEVWGINMLANLCKANADYKQKLLPILLDYLEQCRPIDFAKRVETILPTIEEAKEKELVGNIINAKKPDLSPAQTKKLNSILKKFDMQ